MRAVGVLLLLLLTGAALAGPDNGDHDPRPLPQIVETSAAASCHLSQEERARVLLVLDRACHAEGQETDWHACALAEHVRGMQCAGPQRLPVALLGLGLLLLLGWMVWMGAARRGKEQA